MILLIFKINKSLLINLIVYLDKKDDILSK